ncbi:MAG: hypothetical protein WDO16_02230 [Bacteroidota bacterium]
MKKRLLFISLLINACTTVIYAQDVLYKQDVMPHSPEASAFAKNVLIPMSYVSGTPQIGIPFYTVKSGSLQAPVSLSYNASGIRVEETPAWVGLGWNLNAGGQITRTVRGDPDERPSYGYMNVPDNRKVKYVDTAHCRCIDPPINSQSWTIEHQLNTYHQLDLEPDQYNFSAMGYSGEFYYNQDSARFILVPYQNIDVESIPGGFRLTLPDGTRCSFGGGTADEVLTYGTSASYIDGVSSDAVVIGNVPYTTSWMLTNVVDPIGKAIDFTYTSETIITFNRGGERVALPNGPEAPYNSRQSFLKQYITKPVLQMISGESGNIYFKRSSSYRLDMADSSLYGSKSLDTIVVTNPQQ